MRNLEFDRDGDLKDIDTGNNIRCPFKIEGRGMYCNKDCAWLITNSIDDNFSIETLRCRDVLIGTVKEKANDTK